MNIPQNNNGLLLHLVNPVIVLRLCVCKNRPVI